MDSMQAEALRRAQEMHSKVVSRNFASNRDAQTQIEKTNQPQNTQREDITQNEVSTDCKASFSTSEAVAPALFEDKEKLLILVLILLLMGENSTDTSVILALLYLII